MKVLRIVIPAACLGMLLYLCAYKVGNTDFWWHIKAGQLLRESGWISTDPFAFTRVGEPYLANHEWLAQVAMSLVYDTLGSMGIITMRFLIVLVTFGCFLLLDKSRAWSNALLALLAVALARPALTDRPQLFTFLIFSAVLYFCLAYLQGENRDRRLILGTVPILFLIWSNVHGAAGIVGIGLLGALSFQRIVDGAGRTEVHGLIFTGLLSSAALIATPSGIDNVLYAFTLMGDKTTELIAEWQSVSFIEYIKHIGLFWVIALVSLWRGKKNLVFSTLTLLGIGYLSYSALRHEILFIIAALGLTVHQLRGLPLCIQRDVLRNTFVVGSLLVVVFLTYIQATRFTIRNNSFGFGEFTPLRSASNFVHQQEITGNMFNNYNAGGELLFRDHKVFLDGRNLDYGYTYLKRALDAGTDLQQWNELAAEYDITHAVIYYQLEADQETIPYVSILQQSSEWGLQYLDDWAAVYVRDEQDRLEFITPKMLQTTELPGEITLGNLMKLQEEVQWIAAQNPDGKKAEEYHQAMLDAFGR